MWEWCKFKMKVKDVKERANKGGWKGLQGNIEKLEKYLGEYK